MEQREKLIELILNFYDGDSICDTCEKDKRYFRCNECLSTHEADYLIANGVVVLPCRCGECINRYDEVICPMVISHESFDEDDGYDVWYEDLTTDDFYCANAKRKGGELK